MPCTRASQQVLNERLALSCSQADTHAHRMTSRQRRVLQSRSWWASWNCGTQEAKRRHFAEDDPPGACSVRPAKFPTSKAQRFACCPSTRRPREVPARLAGCGFSVLGRRCRHGRLDSNCLSGLRGGFPGTSERAWTEHGTSHRVIYGRLSHWDMWNSRRNPRHITRDDYGVWQRQLGSPALE